MPKIRSVRQAKLRQNYRTDVCIDAFYTGGCVAVTDDAFVTQRGNVVAVVDPQKGCASTLLGDSADATDISCFALHASTAFVAYANGLLRGYALSDGATQRTLRLNHRAPVLCMAFHTMEEVMATGSADGTLKIWHLTTAVCSRPVRLTGAPISALAFTPDLLFAADSSGALRAFDIATANQRAALDDVHSSTITALLFSQANQCLYSVSRDQTLSVIDAKTLKAVQTIPLFESLECALLLDDVLMVGSANGHLHTLEAKNGKVKILKKREVVIDESVSIASIHNVSHIFGAHHVCAVTSDHRLVIVDRKSGGVMKQLAGYNDEVLSICRLKENILVGCNSPSIRMYDEQSLNCTLLEGHRDSVLCLDAYKHQSVFASGSKDGDIRVWKIDADNTVKCVATAEGHTAAVTAVRFSKGRKETLEGSFLASASRDNTLKIWKMCKFEEVITSLKTSHNSIAHDKEITCIDASSLDASLIATGSLDKTAKVWKLSQSQELELLTTLKGHKRGIWDVGFSSVDPVVASCSGDTTLKLFSYKDGSCVRTFEGHECAVLRVEFLSGGQQLVSADTAGLMKLWTIRSNECEKTFEAHTDKTWALAVEGDGEVILTGGADSSVKVWKDITQEEFAETESKEIESMQMEQELSNLLKHKAFGRALKLALQLDRPFDTLRILKQLSVSEEKDISVLKDLLATLSSEQLITLLGYVTDWNTNTRHCHVAQMVLNVIFRLHRIEDLMKLPGVRAILEGLLPYTERHYERLARLKQQATFVEYMYYRMQDGVVSEVVEK